MKALYTIIIGLFIFTFLHASESQLTVQIKGIEDIEGNIMFAMYDSADAFNNDGKPLKVARLKVTGHNMTVEYNDLKPGTYGIMLYHDKNSNNKLDSLPLIGIPLEAYGVSNNPKLLGSPSFDVAAFKVEAGDNEQIIYLSGKPKK